MGAIFRVPLAGAVFAAEILYSDADLNTAMKSFTAFNLDELPVVDAEDSGRLLGMLRRKEAIAACNQRVMEHKQAREE